MVAASVNRPDHILTPSNKNYEQALLMYLAWDGREDFRKGGCNALKLL